MTRPHWTPETFAERRQRVLDALGQGAAMVLPAAPEIIVGRDIELRYVPDPDLWYLTGYDEPDAVLVLRPDADDPVTLFLRDRDPQRELWTGPREDPEAIGERLGIETVAPVDALAELLPGLLRKTDRIYFRMGTGRGDVESLVLDILGGGRSARQRSGRGPAELADPGLLLDEMRLVKSPDEIQAIRDAVRITVDAFHDAFRAIRPGAGEWEVEAAVEAGFRRAGADGPAFASIAASGPNATVLHYTTNDRTMAAGDLLLLDAGARHRIYNADLTRTVPVDGRLAGPARDVYLAVLDAQHAAIAAVRPDATTDDLHDAALDALLPAMIDLGLLEGSPDEIRQRPDSWKPFFPHSTSHWLGLDVHDVGTYAVDGRPRPLEPGMVLTIEPGLYIPRNADAPGSLLGIGVRIEDDVLVTDEGADVLSADLPTDPEALERLLNP
jgi:Xaa-Pro aminopeptidase